MNDDSLTMVKRMIDFFYVMDYDEEVVTPEGAECGLLSGLQVHARMFALADKYNIHELRALSAAKYSSKFKEASSPLEFLDSVPDVYTLTARSVRLL